MRSRLRLFLVLLFAGSSIADITGCNYFDTVKLSEENKLANGSYLYQKVLIPAEATGEYDYEILNDGEKVNVPKHLRGCACKFGQCVRFCCNRNLILDDNERTCSGDVTDELDYEPIVDITLSDGTVVKRHAFNEFIVQEDLPIPCRQHFALDVPESDQLEWKLFENGVLLRVPDNRTMSKQEYCLQPHPITKDNETYLALWVHNCQEPAEVHIAINVVRIISIILMLITSFIYLWIPRLRSLIGYCFVCYMLCLVVTFIMVIRDEFTDDWTSLGCQFNGYSGYFGVMGAFLWLTVISYDLWNSFRSNNYNVQRHTTRHRFFMYSLYVWGVATLLTIIVIIIDHTVTDPSWFPGIMYNSCWIKTGDWSAMLYLYGPMSLQIIFNITMFVLTAQRIVEVRNELKSLTVPEQREKKVNSDSRIFGMFLRLFVIMGITWSFEIFDYLVPDTWGLKKVVQIFDYINSAQGIIIFVLFVLKPSVLKLFLDRIRGNKSAGDEDDTEEGIALQDRNSIVGPNILK